jgi:hypothetical protein
LPAGERIYEIEVVSADEMHLYYERRTDAKAQYGVLKRVKGTWRLLPRTSIIVG